MVGEAIVKDFRIFRDLNREIRSINLKIKQESVTKSRPQQNFLRTHSFYKKKGSEEFMVGHKSRRSQQRTTLQN